MYLLTIYHDDEGDIKEEKTITENVLFELIQSQFEKDKDEQMKFTVHEIGNCILDLS